MQGVPEGTDVAQIEAEILNLGGVVAAHDLHIWQLDEERSVASIHVVCTNRDTWPKLGPQVRKILHKAGIHSATIQAEFESDQITLHKAKTELLEKEGVLEDSEDETTGSTEESDITVVAIAVANACQTPCVSPNCKDLQCC
jgi:zinc transporter 1